MKQTIYKITINQEPKHSNAVAGRTYRAILVDYITWQVCGLGLYIHNHDVATKQELIW